MPIRLLIVTSHPIQYQVPWFRALHLDRRIDLTVLYLALPDPRDQGVGFAKAFEWDVPLMDGYHWRKAPSARGGISSGYFGLRIVHARRDIGETNPDVILVTGWQNFGMLQCLRAAVASGKPVLVRAESNGLAPIGALKKLKARLGLAGVRQMLPIGRANRAFYEAAGLGQRLGPMVPYFVDNEFFAERALSAAHDRLRMRERLGVPGDAVCFLFAGKLIEKKRPLDALHALQRLIQQHGPGAAHLLVVGSGSLEIDLRQYSADHRLPVSFAGFLNQSEMPAAYAAADCLVLPSDYGETWGLVVNEAMACGLPAIISDRVGCGPDLIADDVSGFVHPFGDIEALAEKLLEAAKDPVKLRRMGRAANENVQHNYSVSRAVEGTLAGVDAVLARTS